MNKKSRTIMIFFLLCTFLISFLTPKVVYASNLQYKNPPVVNARSAIAMDVNSKMVLYEKNAREVIPMASTTKIMTCLTAIRYGNIDNKVTISKRAASVGGSTVGYKEGEVISIRELLYGLMLKSGNDAAIAVSEGISGSVENYIKLMNENASEIGLINTHFESPHGLDSDSHYTSAYDLALLTTKAKENNEFNQIVASKSVDGKAMGFSRSYQNINKILYRLEGADGVKTGYTGNAGKCLVTSVKYENHNIVIVVLNCAARWGETEKIMKYIKDNYTYKLVAKGKAILTNRKTADGINVSIYSKEDIILPMKNGVNYEVNIKNPMEIKYGVNKENAFGSLCIYEDSKLVSKYKLYGAFSKLSKTKSHFFFIK